MSRDPWGPYLVKNIRAVLDSSHEINTDLVFIKAQNISNCFKGDSLMQNLVLYDQLVLTSGTEVV